MSNTEKIWQVVHGIPPGRVVTYGQVAAMAGLPGYARFVGTVLKKLPADTRLPWHRVVNARGGISFPKGSDKYWQQRRLLEEEGIVFVNGRLSLGKFGVSQVDA